MVFIGLFHLIRIQRVATDRRWQVLPADTMASFNTTVTRDGQPVGSTYPNPREHAPVTPGIYAVDLSEGAPAVELLVPGYFTSH
ncbi:MAG: hypothetical protein ACYS0K_24065 [Planctomycetota bacterium]